MLTLRDQNSADRELRELACELLGIVERDQDVVLAAIFLNQIAGAYAVRHCTETAIVVCIIARHAQVGARSFARDGRRADHECGHGAPGRFIPQPRRRAHQRGTGRHPPPPFRQRRHAALGLSINDDDWLDLVLLHHENDDGSGYPQGLARAMRFPRTPS
ncbi:hypothetical protein LP419_01200 [Massilia sp. H-1]|nr:hypothetical protein LP419_01200 [Massilia sp. H-1]